MQVFMRDQAQEILNKRKFPINSIGVCRCNDGWCYWYYTKTIFDSGVELTEEEALRTAKMNIGNEI